MTGSIQALRIQALRQSSQQTVKFLVCAHRERVRAVMIMTKSLQGAHKVESQKFLCVCGARDGVLKSGQMCSTTESHPQAKNIM